MMKIRITSESKQLITLADMPAVREIQRQEAEDTMTPAEYLEMAARLASRSNNSFQIYDASARIARNCRVYEQFGPGTGTFDVWLEGIAFHPFAGAYMIGAYLSDLWQITGGPSDEYLVRDHMFIKEYRPI